jgi:hypothetical protein
MAKPIEGVKLTSSQQRWLTDKVQNKKVDQKKQAQVERRERQGASRVTVS